MGTGHGTPYLYDQTVPIIMAGPGVVPGRMGESVSMTRIAPTVAAAVGILPPPAAYASPLSAVRP